jgi:hypothetical protein
MISLSQAKEVPHNNRPEPHHKCVRCLLVYYNELNVWQLTIYDDGSLKKFSMYDDKTFQRMAKLKAFW